MPTPAINIILFNNTKHYPENSEHFLICITKNSETQLWDYTSKQWSEHCFAFSWVNVNMHNTFGHCTSWGTHVPIQCCLYSRQVMLTVCPDTLHTAGLHLDSLMQCANCFFTISLTTNTWFSSCPRYCLDMCAIYHCLPAVLFPNSLSFPVCLWVETIAINVMTLCSPNIGIHTSMHVHSLHSAHEKNRGSCVLPVCDPGGCPRGRRPGPGLQTQRGGAAGWPLSGWSCGQTPEPHWTPLTPPLQTTQTDERERGAFISDKLSRGQRPQLS